MKSRPIVAVAMVLALGAIASHRTVAAEGYPSRPIRILAGQQAGSATDNVARLVADGLHAALGVPVTVENRPGAGGTIGAEAAAHASADGYTLLVAGTSNLTIGPATDPALRYDPTRDFAPIGRVAFVPFVFAVNAGVPAATLGELAKLARSRPGTLTYVTLGPATTTGFGMELFRAEAGVDMLGVEYKGIASAIPDLLAGRVDAIFNEIAVLSQHAQAGRLRLLAVASPQRNPRFPDLATSAEQGFPRATLGAWYGLLAPAGIGPDVHKRLVEAYEAATHSPEVRKRIEALGYEPIAETPAEFAKALRDDIATIRAISR